MDVHDCFLVALGFLLGCLVTTVIDRKENRGDKQNRKV